MNQLQVGVPLHRVSENKNCFYRVQFRAYVMRGGWSLLLGSLCSTHTPSTQQITQIEMRQPCQTSLFLCTNKQSFDSEACSSEQMGTCLQTISRQVPTYAFCHICIHLSSHPQIHQLIHSPAHSSTHTFAQSLTQTLTHPLTHPPLTERLNGTE